jgi:hypothetical protein
VRAPASQILPLLGLGLLASGCAGATAGRGFDGRAKQADEKLPAAARFYDPAERKAVEGAQGHQAAARKLQDEGSLDKARAEAGAAAAGYAAFADSFAASEWRIAIRYKAAELHLFARQPDRAAALADRVGADPDASAPTRAMAAQLSAVAWRDVALARIKAGQLEAVKLPSAEARAGAPLAPRPLPEPWARFVAAIDAFVPLWEKHPEAAKRPADRNLAITPWLGSLVAAEQEYGADEVAAARRRLEGIVARWPGELDVMEGAVQLLLKALLVLGDEPGFEAAVARLPKELRAQGAAAADGPAKERWAKLADAVVQAGQKRAFAAARRLVEGGRDADGAAAFERLAEAWSGSPDASLALFNAAIAWDKAGEPGKATSAREALVERYGDSEKAPLAQLQLAGGASKRGDHPLAARRYALFVERWPEAANRCLALQNLGYELDVQGERAAAAERYLAFGTTPACAKERPNDVAKALYRSGKLYVDGQQKAKAKEAFEAATRVEGVNDAAALQQVADAKRQVQRL